MTDREKRTPGLWTQRLVVERLEEAAQCLRALPAPKEWVRLRHLRSAMPTPVRDAADAYGYTPTRTRPPAPSPGAIDRMEQAIAWLLWLDPEDQRLVWARACRIPWRHLCHRSGVERTTAWRTWTLATFRIVTRINRHAAETRDVATRASANRIPAPRASRRRTILAAKF